MMSQESILASPCSEETVHFLMLQEYLNKYLQLLLLRVPAEAETARTPGNKALIVLWLGIVAWHEKGEFERTIQKIDELKPKMAYYCNQSVLYTTIFMRI